MAPRDRRQKASDVFAGSTPFLGERSTFVQAFPTIAKLTVEVNEEGDGVSEYRRRRFYDNRNAGEFVDCSNPRCYNGGFNLGWKLRSMVQGGETERRDLHDVCQGYEGSPKGRRNYGSCMNFFSYHIRIEYSAPSDEAPGSAD